MTMSRLEITLAVACVVCLLLVGRMLSSGPAEEAPLKGEEADASEVAVRVQATGSSRFMSDGPVFHHDEPPTAKAYRRRSPSGPMHMDEGYKQSLEARKAEAKKEYLKRQQLDSPSKGQRDPELPYTFHEVQNAQIKDLEKEIQENQSDTNSAHLTVERIQQLRESGNLIW